MSKARQLADLGNVYDDGALSNRNVIVNGAMVISQRGTSFTSVGNGDYTLDRFRVYSSGGGVFNVDQASDGPDDFTKSLKVTVATNDASIGSSDYYILNSRLEGYDTAKFNFGTSAAKTVTLSFYVKSSLTGTFGGSFTNSSEANAYIFSYTINAANTWERKTVTITGQTSGTWATDNTNSIRIYWDLGCGSGNVSGSTGWGSGAYGLSSTVQLVGTSSATWQITGVQLEVGDTATPFEHRSYGDELARCQRYYYKTYNDSTAPSTATNVGIVSSTLSQSFQNTGYIELYNVPYAVKMRASPTITVYDTSGNSGKCNYYQSATLVVNNTITSHAMSENGFAVYSDNVTSKGGIGFHFTADAEL